MLHTCSFAHVFTVFMIFHKSDTISWKNIQTPRKIWVAKRSLSPSLHSSTSSPTPTAQKSPPLETRHQIRQHMSINTLFKTYKWDSHIGNILYSVSIGNNILRTAFQDSTCSCISFCSMTPHFHMSQKQDSFFRLLGNHCCLYYTR